MLINEVEQEIANYQTGHAGGRLATADRILNKVRADTLKEVESWLSEACPHLQPTLQQRQQCWVCMAELVECLEQGKMPGEE